MCSFILEKRQRKLFVSDFKDHHLHTKHRDVQNKVKITSDGEFSGALCPPQRVFCNDLVLPGVFGSNPQYEQRTDSAGVGDEVVSVGIQTDIVAEPCHMRCRIPFYSTAHVAFIALRGTVHFQWDKELGRTL